MLRDEGVEDCDIWNIDKTGFQVSVISRRSLVVTCKAVKAAYIVWRDRCMCRRSARSLGQ
jgi:hypothetical protein